MGKYTFHDFGSLKNSVISSPSDGYGTELTSVVDAIENQLYVDPARLSRFFWLMTVTDAFIGNLDRHNGNWGFLTDNATGEWLRFSIAAHHFIHRLTRICGKR